MTDISSSAFGAPINWQDFEKHTRVLFEAILKDPHASMNGRQGQAQHGVDVYGRRDGGHWVGVQCKGKDADFGGQVTAAELRAEVKKTKLFEPAIAEFFLVTTAADDGKIQREARLLEDELRAEGRMLRISVWGWGQMRDRIAEHPTAIKAFHPDATPYTDQFLASQRKITEDIGELKDIGYEALRHLEGRNLAVPIEQSIKIPIPSRSSNADEADVHLNRRIDGYRDFIKDGKSQTALQLLNILKDEVWTYAADKIKFRILSNLGAANYNLGEYEAAARFFLEAFDFSPDDPAAHSNKIAALLLLEKKEEAHLVAEKAIKTFPENTDVVFQRIQARLPDENINDLIKNVPEKIANSVDIVFAKIISAKEKSEDWHTLAFEAFKKFHGQKKIDLLYAEAVLDSVLKEDASASGKINSPTQNDLEKAADIFSKAWEASSIKEGKADPALGHNAGLLLAILRRTEDAIRIIDSVIDKEYIFDEIIRLRLALDFSNSAKSELRKKLISKLDNSDVNRILKADLLLREDPVAAREALGDLESFTTLRDSTAAFSIVIDSFIAQGDSEKALEAARKLNASYPNDPMSTLLLFRAMSAAKHDNAEQVLDTLKEKITNETPNGVIHLVADTLEREKRYDDVVDLLVGRVSTLSDSPLLRILVAAAANGDRRVVLNNILNELPEKLSVKSFYHRAKISLAIRAGDSKIIERELKTGIRLLPRDLALHLQLMRILMVNRKENELRHLLKKNASQFDGEPAEFIQLAQFKDRYGNWHEAHELAYRTLLNNRHDPQVALFYIGLFLAPGHSNELIIKPEQVGHSMAVGLTVKDDEEVYVIEPEQTLRITAQQISPSHQISELLLGKAEGDRITLPDGGEAVIQWIKPKQLYELHEILGGFQNLFPDVKGLEKVELSEDQSKNIEPIIERVKQRDQAIDQLFDAYKDKRLPIYMIARTLGGDPIEVFYGLISKGRSIIVCDGNFSEREAAFAALEANSKRGCVLDQLTLHVVRMLGVEEAVRSVCGPIGIIDDVLLRPKQKIYELEQNINKPTLTLLVENGEVVKHELKPAEKQDIAKKILSEQSWIENNTEIITAIGSTDPKPEVRRLVQELGSGFANDMLAAQGANRIFITEDFGLRSIASQIFNIPTAWLQPILMAAHKQGHLSDDGYGQAIYKLIESNFRFVSIDGNVLIWALNISKVELSKEFLVLCSRLGGEGANLDSHIDVASRALTVIWHNGNYPFRIKAASTSKILFNLSRGLDDDHLLYAYGGLTGFNMAILRNEGFENYLQGWLKGHFLILPGRHTLAESFAQRWLSKLTKRTNFLESASLLAISVDP